MKNKKATLMLLALALIIWLMVFYKIFTALFVNEEPDAPVGEFLKPASNGLAPDTFSLLANYRDPFLGRMEDKKSVPPPLSQNPPALSEKKETRSAVWPPVIYGGTIRNQNSQKNLALVSINGKDNIMQQDNEKEGIRLLAITADSIEIGFTGSKKWIRKK